MYLENLQYYFLVGCIIVLFLIFLVALHVINKLIKSNKICLKEITRLRKLNAAYQYNKGEDND